MGKCKSPGKASDREKKWNETFNALVKLSKNLQRERQFLEDRVNCLQKVIYEMKMDKNFEASRAELLFGLKDREAFVYKHRYENATSELADFGECFVYLTQKCEEPKDNTRNRGEDSRNMALQNEMKKLKSEIEKCKSDKKTEISALLAEKNFVWHQLKRTEADLSKEIKRKDKEVKYANEKLCQIVNTAEELQLSHEKLRTDHSRLELESIQKSEEISKLSKEIELLKSRPDPPSALLCQCRGLGRRGKSGDTSNGRIIKVKKEADNSQSSEKTAQTRQTDRKSTGGKAPRKQFSTKGSSSSSSSRLNLKRKVVDIITIPDSPKLFSSSFKVPKLKHSASPKID